MQSLYSQQKAINTHALRFRRAGNLFQVSVQPTGIRRKIRQYMVEGLVAHAFKPNDIHTPVSV